jgi:hypothetical protein
MKFRIAILGLAFAIVSPCAGAQSAPLDRAEVLGRLAVCYPPSYVAKLVKVRGIRFSPTADFVYRIKLAGGDGILADRLMSADSERPAAVPMDDDGPVDHLAKCAELIHTGATEAAEPECRTAIAESPKSSWPPLVAADLVKTNLLTLDPTESQNKKAEEYSNLLQRATALDPTVAAVQSFASSWQIAPRTPPEVAASIAQDFQQRQSWPAASVAWRVNNGG